LNHLNKFMRKIIYILFLGVSLSQYAPDFNGEKAYEFLLKQCSFGPRYPGSSGHIDFKNYLIKYLNKYSDNVKVMEHDYKHPYENKNIKFYNILSQYNIKSDNRILLMAHWDTREIADKEEDIIKQKKPIIGANDGASGIAILMLFAEILSNNHLNNIGVDLLFVDGEDMGRNGELNNFCLGSKLFAKSMKYKVPSFAICLDMVADKDPEFKMEYFSYLQAPKELFEIWELANELGYDEFTYDMTNPIYDDHRAFYNETGIPSIDIIDFDYPYWHTLEDTPDKCSASTLKIVGDVVLEYIFRLDNKNE